MTLPGNALEWIEAQCGGRIVDVEQQVRWRPHHFVTLDRDGERIEVLARSERDPSITRHSRLASHFDIAHEARVLAAIQGHGITVPTFLGFNEEFRFILMERMPGSNLLADAADDATRVRLMNEYYEQLALLHDLDPAPLVAGMPEIEIPVTPEDLAFAGKFRFMELDYIDARPKIRPEPLLDLGVWWLHANIPRGERPVRFIQGDTGPGQFLFEGDRITALIDWELAHVGDPMLDLGVGRMRNMLYPTCSLREPLEAYVAAGRSIDWDVLRFYTVMSMLMTPLGTSRTLQNPTPRVSDMMVRFGWDVTLRRGLTDALAEVLDLEVEPPELPDADEVRDPSLATYLVEHLELKCLPVAHDAAERFEVESAVAVARALQLDARVGDRLRADDLDDMGAVLGRRPADRADGFAQLHRIVDERPEEHLHELVRMFSRVERRREFLWRPLMVAQESAAFEPLAPSERSAAERPDVFDASANAPK